MGSLYTTFLIYSDENFFLHHDAWEVVYFVNQQFFLYGCIYDIFSHPLIKYKWIVPEVLVYRL